MELEYQTKRMVTPLCGFLVAINFDSEIVTLHPVPSHDYDVITDAEENLVVNLKDVHLPKHKMKVLKSN